MLTVGVQETAEDAGREAAAIGSLRRDEGGLDRFYTSLGEAWTRGVAVDWAAVYEGTGATRVELPTYAFQHQSYWPRAADAPADASGAPSDAVDARFWEAVEREDLESLADTLAFEDDGERSSLGAVLPALASWRKQAREQSTVDGWRYRVTWTSLTDAQAPRLSGTWLLAVPESAAIDDWTLGAVRMLTERGAEVRQITPAAVESDRASLTRLVREELADAGAVSGVLSLLAFDTGTAPGTDGVSAGLVGTAVLIQALGDAGVDAPLWCATRGAVAVGQADQVESPSRRSSGGSAEPPPWSTRSAGAVWWTCPVRPTSGRWPGSPGCSPGPTARTSSRCARPGCSPAGSPTPRWPARPPYGRGSRPVRRWSPAVRARWVPMWRAGWPQAAPSTWCSPAAEAWTPRALPNCGRS
ncbi:hypothetical protein SVIO_043550 [Streptomyces violaceusniger]|uniref:Polyketide synthase dimerisation element domain-containing protein n=1 Tax=Streptomyces violaceusniger TaxID=68280 RepID=A0A4D4KY29_STRVO|nr:hypothetical protein SVIO_043550 [Streptomyces violaceusniger]